MGTAKESASSGPASSGPTSSGPARVRGAIALAVGGVLAFTLPLIGFLGSLLLPVFASQVGRRLWPRTSRTVVILCGALVVVGFWLPAALSLFSQGRLGLESTIWLVLPLCAPSGAALLVPAVMAGSAYLIGLTLSALLRTPWPWVVGAWTAPLAYAAAAHWLVDFALVC